ncbi:MAG: hypothetical protein QNI89_08990 [Desulfobacterales bacterium]|nr:hypothetical protein [Desulfobacterales bacterium]MDJ0887423.1 hypothetical protein [Desulfobacterales bacterium]
MHVAQTLARALSRFGFTSSDTLCVAWRRTPRRAHCGRQTLRGQRCMPGDEAVAMLAQHERTTGFILSAAKGRPQLQVH